jgi:RNA polymerase I-specific transcription initiation factor RRN3
MVPTSPTKLLQLIIQSMPHKLRDRNTQCLYMSAVFGLAERPGGGPIRDGLLAAAVDQLLSIDVEIRWEDIVEGPSGESVQG